MGLYTEQIEKAFSRYSRAGEHKYMKNQRNRKIRRGSKALDKRVYELEFWHDNDEEGNFSIEADYQYPNHKQYKGWEF